MIPDIFEGPLDLLIHLIKKEKISIYDVSITKITDKIWQILIFLSYNQNTYLEKILGGNYEKQNIIVTYLALLALVKTGSIQLNQSVTFGELKISASNNIS